MTIHHLTVPDSCVLNGFDEGDRVLVLDEDNALQVVGSVTADNHGNLDLPDSLSGNDVRLVEM